MLKKNKKLFLSLGAVSTVIAPVSTVIACSGEDTNTSVLETLKSDGSSLQETLGAGEGSTTYASVVTEDQIVTALNTEGADSITKTDVVISNASDLTGTLTFTVTYGETTYDITVTRFAIDQELLLTTLSEDGSSLQAALGAGEGSTTYASVVTADQIVAALNAEGADNITKTDVVISNASDLTGTLTFTVTYGETTYDITVTGFAIDEDFLKFLELLLIPGSEINVNDYWFIEDFFDPRSTLPSDITDEDFKDILTLIAPDFVALADLFNIEADDENGILHISLSIFVYNIDCKLTGFATNGS